MGGASPVSPDTELVSSALLKNLSRVATKAQHARAYARIPTLLRALREEAGMTQRRLGAALHKPQSWVYNCETGNRRVDVAEFARWAEACSLDPIVCLRRFLAER